MVRLVAYDPQWKRLFGLEKACLQEVLGLTILDIQHMGSTSIPGMLAKPIIDIAIAIADFEEGRVCIPLIEELGNEYKVNLAIPCDTTSLKVTRAHSMFT